jgi:hypothetical protein
MLSFFTLNLYYTLLGVLAKCPGSPAKMHAVCEMEVAFEDSCESVREEILARIHKQNSEWHDPHNNGTYSLQYSDEFEFEVSRRTGDGRYTDKMILTFLDQSDGGCNIDACSKSQVLSLLDFSTNYCNIHDLYCSENGCRPFSKLAFVEKFASCKQRNADDCLKF